MATTSKKGSFQPRIEAIREYQHKVEGRGELEEVKEINKHREDEPDAEESSLDISGGSSGVGGSMKYPAIRASGSSDSDYDSLPEENLPIIKSNALATTKLNLDLANIVPITVPQRGMDNKGRRGMDSRLIDTRVIDTNTKNMNMNHNNNKGKLLTPISESVCEIEGSGYEVEESVHVKDRSMLGKYKRKAGIVHGERRASESEKESVISKMDITWKPSENMSMEQPWKNTNISRISKNEISGITARDPDGRGQSPRGQSPKTQGQSPKTQGQSPECEVQRVAMEGDLRITGVEYNIEKYNISEINQSDMTQNTTRRKSRSVLKKEEGASRVTYQLLYDEKGSLVEEADQLVTINLENIDKVSGKGKVLVRKTSRSISPHNESNADSADSLSQNAGGPSLPQVPITLTNYAQNALSNHPQYKVESVEHYQSLTTPSVMECTQKSGSLAGVVQGIPVLQSQDRRYISMGYEATDQDLLYQSKDLHYVEESIGSSVNHEGRIVTPVLSPVNYTEEEELEESNYPPSSHEQHSVNIPPSTTTTNTSNMNMAARVIRYEETMGGKEEDPRQDIQYTMQGFIDAAHGDLGDEQIANAHLQDDNIMQYKHIQSERVSDRLYLDHQIRQVYI